MVIFNSYVKLPEGSKKLIHMFKHIFAVFVGYLTKQKSEKK